MKRFVALAPIAVFFALVAVFGLYALHHNPQVIPRATVGTLAPNDALPTLDGAPPAPLHTALKGTTLVNFFASWCVPCRIEHPVLGRLAGEGVALLGIAWKDKPEDARSWLAQLGDPYRRLALDRDGRVGIDFGVYGVPETYVIDRTGKIRYRQAGPITPEDLEGKILPLLAALKR